MNNKNLPLIVGIALPVVFIIIISVVIYLPALFVNPAHNFLYSISTDYYAYNQGYANTFSVKNNHLVLVPSQQLTRVGDVYKDTAFRADMPPLYEYDLKTDTSHEISFEEASKLTLDPGPSSPDGYQVKYEYNNDGVFELFGSSGTRNSFYISKGSSQKRLSGLSGNQSWYEGNFKLIGWEK